MDKSDRIVIKTDGREVVSVVYTDSNGKEATIENVADVQVFRTLGRRQSKKEVSLTLYPREVIWDDEIYTNLPVEPADPRTDTGKSNQMGAVEGNNTEDSDG